MRADNRDFFDKFTEFLILHMLVGVKFTDLPDEPPCIGKRVNISFNVPEKYMDPDKTVHSYEDIIDSIKTGLANISNIKKNDISDLVNFTYDIRYNEIFTDDDSKEIFKNFEIEITNLKLLLDKRKGK